MKILIVYYSRTNVTANVVDEVSKKLNCDIEKINDLSNRSGPLNYLKSGYDAIRKNETKIGSTKKNPSDYDLVIIGTPVWAGTMSSPILTYLNQNIDKIKNLCVIVTFGSSGDESTIRNIEKIINKHSIASLKISRKDFKSSFTHKVDEFVNKIEKI
ncbi:MAG: flavodoxin [Methanobrevibacter sp.]|jgi:flavodoxin|nr:flavodoxin [Methanobrevibacter sp.]